MSRLRLTAFCMALVVAAAVSACGGGEEAPATAIAPTSAPTAISAPAATAAPTQVITTSGQTASGGTVTGTVLDNALDPAPFELDNVRYGGTINLQSSSSLGYLDPKYLTQINGIWPAAEKLVRWAPNEKDVYSHLEPALAESWKLSSDFKTYTLNIPKGVKWHNISPVDGREFTADDAVYNIRRYGEKDSVKLPLFAQIASVEADDKHTVTIKLKEPTAWLLYDLFAFAEWMVPPELVSEAGGTLKTKFIGTGPFILKDFRFRQSELYVRNPDYWGKDAQGRVLPYLDEVRYLFITDQATVVASFRTGQIDTGPSLSNNGLETLEAIVKSLPGTRLVSTGEAPFTGLGFNTQKAPWNDVRVRHAFNMLIDKDRFVQLYTTSPKIYYTTPLRWADVSDKPFTTEEMGPYWKFNPAEAKRLLIEAGFEGGKMKVNSPLHYASQSRGFALYSQIFQQMYKENGIQIDLLGITNAEYYNKWYLRVHEDLTLNFVNTPDYSLNWYGQNRFKSGSIQNQSLIDDPEVDRVVREIKVTSDPAKLKQLARFLWNFDTLGSYQIWIANETGFAARSPRTRNYVLRVAASFAAPTYFPWLTDAPRTSP